jgi:limonene-1,2-epoxide hydrolase
MPDTERNRATTEALWQALYDRDWDRVGSFFAPDGLYQDVPAPDMGAVGPEAVARRLRIGHEPVARHEHTIFRIVAEADCVITEHREDWYFHTGEVVKLPFTSIHEYDDAGRIRLWRDYWDLGTLMNNAPAWWLEHVMSADGEEFGHKETIE